MYDNKTYMRKTVDLNHLMNLLTRCIVYQKPERTLGN